MAERTICAGCGEPVELSDQANDLRRTFSAVLESRGQRPILAFEVGHCDACRRGWRAERASAAAREWAERLRARAVDRVLGPPSKEAEL
jgi:hypothetical protein